MKQKSYTKLFLWKYLKKITKIALDGFRWLLLKKNETNWWFGVLQNLELIQKWKYDFLMTILHWLVICWATLCIELLEPPPLARKCYVICLINTTSGDLYRLHKYNILFHFNHKFIILLHIKSIWTQFIYKLQCDYMPR